MGSSPVTATIRTGPMDVLQTLEVFFRHEAPLDPGDGLVVAFSGGPDSTALLWGMSRLAARRGLRLHAAHLDHALDAGSAARAAAAARLAARLGVPLIHERSTSSPAAGRPRAPRRRRGGRATTSSSGRGGGSPPATSPPAIT